MSNQKIPQRNESKLQEHLFNQRNFTIKIAGRSAKSLNKELKLKPIASEAWPVIYEQFKTVPSLFGPYLTGIPKRRKRFDLVARPVPKEAQLFIIELKIGKLTFGDVGQLLGYMNLVRSIQRNGGENGRRLISKALKFTLTERTKIHGVLIGKTVGDDLLQQVPGELWEHIRFCTWKVKEGKWPNDIQSVQICDQGYKYRRLQRKNMRQLRMFLNPESF